MRLRRRPLDHGYSRSPAGPSRTSNAHSGDASPCASDCACSRQAQPPEPRTHWTDGRGFIPSSMRGVLSCLAPNQSSSSDAGALRDLGDSVPREAVAVARADRKAGAEWIESVQDRSQTITGTSGTTGPPRLTSHLVRKGGKGMDERARGLDDEQATLAVVVGVDTRLCQCPSDLPCLVGRYDLTWVAAGQP